MQDNEIDHMPKNNVGGKLTPKQEKFALAYIETGNASEAYRLAGYNAGNAKTTNEAASRLLKNSKVVARVDELRAAIVKRHDVTIDKIVRELALIGFANMSDYIQTQNDGSAYVDLSKLTREQAAAIGEITSETYLEGKGDDAKNVKRTKFKLSDKRAALVDLGKHLGMFKEIHELTGKDGGPIETVDASPRDEIARRIAGITARIGTVPHPLRPH